MNLFQWIALIILAFFVFIIYKMLKKLSLLLGGRRLIGSQSQQFTINFFEVFVNHEQFKKYYNLSKDAYSKKYKDWSEEDKQKFKQFQQYHNLGSSKTIISLTYLASENVIHVKASKNFGIILLSSAKNDLANVELVGDGLTEGISLKIVERGVYQHGKKYRVISIGLSEAPNFEYHHLLDFPYINFTDKSVPSDQDIANFGFQRYESVEQVPSDRLLKDEFGKVMLPSFVKYIHNTGVNISDYSS